MAGGEGVNPSTSAQLQRLAEPLRSKLAALLAATGERVWIVSGLRSVDEQVQLRRKHCGTTWDDIWRKPASQCSPPTAIPGTSKHQKGLAVDLGGDLALAKRLAGQLGLATPVAGEPWHFEPTTAALSLTAGDIPGAGIIDDLGDVVGGVAGGAAGAVSGALGELVEPLLGGLRRITLVGLLLAGGITLVVLGGIRGTKGEP